MVVTLYITPHTPGPIFPSTVGILPVPKYVVVVGNMSRRELSGGVPFGFGIRFVVEQSNRPWKTPPPGGVTCTVVHGKELKDTRVI